MQKPERSIAPRERLKAFTEEKLVISHGKLFQTLITPSEKKHRPGCYRCSNVGMLPGSQSQSRLGRVDERLGLAIDGLGSWYRSWTVRLRAHHCSRLHEALVLSTVL